MNVIRILTFIFLLMAGYGAGSGKWLPAIMSFGMAGLMVYGDRVFKKMDTEHDKLQRAKARLTETSERMLEFHSCEALAHNPAIGLQVSD